MPLRGPLSVLLVGALLVGGAASADPLALARTRFEDGTAAFQAGHCVEAAKDFEDAYALSRRPELLWNISVAYRKQYELDGDAAHLRKARLLLGNLVELAPSADLGAEARRALWEVEEALHLPSRGPAPPLPDRGRSALDLTPPPAATPPERVPPSRRWWFWTAIAGVVVIGGATGLAIGLAPRDGAVQPSAGGSYAPVFP